MRHLKPICKATIKERYTSINSDGPIIYFTVTAKEGVGRIPLDFWIAVEDPNLIESIDLILADYAAQKKELITLRQAYNSAMQENIRLKRIIDEMYNDGL